MQRLFLASIAVLAMSAAAFGDELSITFGPPAIEVYPPGADTSYCQTYGVAPCVVFSGTITDNDTDDNGGNDVTFLDLTNVATNLPAQYFTVDSTFFSNGPGVLVGDQFSATDGNFLSNTYTGPIFGLDIATDTPVGVYQGIADFSYDGGPNDPDMDLNFTELASFTVVVAPEPSPLILAITGLLALALFRSTAPLRRNTVHLTPAVTGDTRLPES